MHCSVQREAMSSSLSLYRNIRVKVVARTNSMFENMEMLQSHRKRGYNPILDTKGAIHLKEIT